jgi:hypothetical protein
MGITVPHPLLLQFSKILSEFSKINLPEDPEVWEAINRLINKKMVDKDHPDSELPLSPKIDLRTMNLSQVTTAEQDLILYLCLPISSSGNYAEREKFVVSLFCRHSTPRAPSDPWLEHEVRYVALLIMSILQETHVTEHRPIYISCTTNTSTVLKVAPLELKNMSRSLQ